VTELETILQALPPASRVLDLGGWFKPLAAATHVVDLMPYETRRGVLTPEPVAGELFSRATWTQANFLSPGFRLPFADRFFALVTCGHTLEDLTDPAPLLAEIQRVGQAGVIWGPTRLSEQTRGVRDRQCREPGHPHHHWIVDPIPRGLRFCAKADSLPGGAALPLRHYERTAGPGEFLFHWRDRFAVDFVRGEAAATLARDFARRQAVRPSDRWLDPLTRRGRAGKRRLLRSPPFNAPEAWWARMLEISRPFSAIPLQ
jgi:hypothetical protein